MRGFGRRKIAWAWLSSQQRRLDGERMAGSNALPSVLPTLFWFDKGFSLTLALRQTHLHITCCTAVSSSRVLQAPFCTLTRLKIKDWGAKYIKCRCSFIGPADERKLTRSGSWIGVVGEEVDEVGAGAVASGAMGFAVLAVGDDDPDRSCPPCSSSRRAARAVLGCGR